MHAAWTGRTTFPGSRTHCKLKAFWRRIGASMDLPSGETVSNIALLPSLGCYFRSIAVRIAAGNFGEVFLFPIPDSKSLVYKRCFQAPYEEKLHRALAMCRKGDTALRRSWTGFGPDLVPVERGYVMLESNEDGRSIEWLHTLLDWAVLFGVLHLDLKPSNLHRGGLIDWDNMLFQCAGLGRYCQCDQSYYRWSLGTAAKNEIQHPSKWHSTQSQDW